MKRNWFWFVLLLMPFIAFTASALFSDGLQVMIDSNFELCLDTCFGAFQVQVFYNMFNNVFSSINWYMPYWLLSAVSYATGVLMVRIIYEVVVFLPQFAISVFERRMKK